MAKKPADASAEADAHAAAVDAAADAKLAAATLRGDLRDFLIERMRRFDKPWGKLGEMSQRLAISDADAMAERLIGRIVEIVAVAGAPVVRATLKQATVKDFLELKLQCSRECDGRSELLDALGTGVLITIPGVERFRGQRAPAKPDPDEPPLFDETRTGQRANGEAHA